MVNIENGEALDGFISCPPKNTMKGLFPSIVKQAQTYRWGVNSRQTDGKDRGTLKDFSTAAANLAERSCVPTKMVDAWCSWPQQNSDRGRTLSWSKIKMPSLPSHFLGGFIMHGWRKFDTCKGARKDTVQVPPPDHSHTHPMDYLDGEAERIPQLESKLQDARPSWDCTKRGSVLASSFSLSFFFLQFIYASPFSH